MRYLTIEVGEILMLHRLLLEQSGGMPGLRDINTLRSAAAQPLMTFDGEDLYPTLLEKASALGFSLIKNHPFVDGNKRIGHAAMEVLLVMNGFEIEASVAEQEEIILGVAAGSIDRDGLLAWLRVHVVDRA